MLKTENANKKMLKKEAGEMKKREWLKKPRGLQDRKIRESLEML